MKKGGRPKPVYWKNHKRRRFTPRERLFIFERDNYTCNKCQKDLANLPQERVLDHIIPLSQLGSNRFDNIWLLCIECDRKKKADILPESISDRINQLKNKHRYLK